MTTIKHEATAQRDYCYNIELSRLIGIFMIMGHHLYMIGFSDEYLFKNCWVWVDFFYILSGAFTYKHFLNNAVNSGHYGSIALDYTVKKFARFFPFTCISVAFMYLLTYGHLLLQKDYRGFLASISYAPFEALYLSSSGILRPLNAPIWFLSAMFITMPVMVFLIQSRIELWKVLSFVLPVLYFGHRGVNTARAWPNDLLRAFVCMSLGTIALMLAEKIKEYAAKSSARKLFCSVMEILCFSVVIYISVFNKNCIDLAEPLFVVVAALMLSQSTFTALLRSEALVFAGKMTMPMFIFQWCVGSIALRVTDNIRTRILIYYLGTVLVGIAAALLYDKLINIRKNRRTA